MLQKPQRNWDAVQRGSCLPTLTSTNSLFLGVIHPCVSVRRIKREIENYKNTPSQPRSKKNITLEYNCSQGRERSTDWAFIHQKGSDRRAGTSVIGEK